MNKTKLTVGISILIVAGATTPVLAQDRVRSVQIQNRTQIEHVETAQRVEVTETASPNPGTLPRVIMGERVREMAQEMIEGEVQRGGIGERVREIARTQVQRVERAEEVRKRIENRSTWQRNIWGGDWEAAKEFRNQIRENLDEIKILREEAKTVSDPEEAQRIEDLAQALESENNELREEAQSEESSRGIFGFFRRIFSR